MLKRLVLLTGLLASQVQAQTYTQDDIDSGEALLQLNKRAVEIAQARLEKSPTEACSPDKLRVRREWRNMPDEERISFTDAVQCLQKKPSVNADIEAAKSLFDDFVVLHMNVTPYHHNSATFLTFHRYYLWTYEQALQKECGYEGTLPYWEWGFDTKDIDSSPVFDGSATSMGSNGKAIEHNPVGGLPVGTGGGCVYKGPFANMTVHLGPIGGMVPPTDDPLKDNPRCLKRDLNAGIGARWASFRNSTELILESGNVEEFQVICQGDPRYELGIAQGMGVHGGGHFMIGGDPGSDFFLSPGEPAFYLHHGQIDRLYWIWQQLEWENRQNIAGTHTMMDQPPSDEVDIDESIDIQPLNVPRVIRTLMDTVTGDPFCFVYSAE